MEQEIEKLSFFQSENCDDVEDYIRENVTDLASARTYLIELSKAFLGLLKVVEKRL